MAHTRAEGVRAGLARCRDLRLLGCVIVVGEGVGGGGGAEKGESEDTRWSANVVVHIALEGGEESHVDSSISASSTERVLDMWRESWVIFVIFVIE